MIDIYVVIYHDSDPVFDLTKDDLCMASLGDTIEDLLDMYTSNELRSISKIFPNIFDTYEEALKATDEDIKHIKLLHSFSNDQSIKRMAETIKTQHPELFL